MAGRATGSRRAHGAICYLDEIVEARQDCGGDSRSPMTGDVPIEKTAS